MHPYYVIRLLGGLMFLTGALIMVYNLILTVRSPSHRAGMPQPPLAGSPRRENKTHVHPSRDSSRGTRFLLLVLTLVTVAIGGIVEIVPLFTIETTVEHVKGVRPYSPLEQRGRDIYVREGCYLCHSQQIRALQDEVERYGHYSLAAESMYDHPFQWGSKRIGPDLARVGGKYSNDWHYAHLSNAQSVVPESLMPHYAFLAETPLEPTTSQARLRALRAVGVPYTDEMIANAAADLAAQANPDGRPTALLKRYPKAVAVPGDGRAVTEMDALVAYLQMLGTHGGLRRSRQRTAAAVDEPRHRGCSFNSLGTDPSCSCSLLIVLIDLLAGPQVRSFERARPHSPRRRR